ncbi:MAG: hypothetical protein IJD60_09730 [Clostridia bacterium]|nr:hypothetical protein [Clostridia bacterium]
MVRRIAQALMMHVYYDMSAVVSLARDGSVMEVAMFDTAFAGDKIRPGAGAEQVWLITGHPMGDTQLNEMDRRNIMRLKRQTPRMPMRVFVAGEDIGVLEVELSCAENL